MTPSLIQNICQYFHFSYLLFGHLVHHHFSESIFASGFDHCALLWAWWYTHFAHWVFALSFGPNLGAPFSLPPCSARISFLRPFSGRWRACFGNGYLLLWHCSFLKICFFWGLFLLFRNLRLYPRRVFNFSWPIQILKCQFPIIDQLLDLRFEWGVIFRGMTWILAVAVASSVGIVPFWKWGSERCKLKWLDVTTSYQFWE